MTSIAILEDLNLLFSGRYRAENWIVPDLVFRASTQARRSFLRAFFDSEGTAQFRFKKSVRYVAAGSKSLVGLQGIERLLGTEGIRSQWDRRELASGPFWVLRISDRLAVEAFAQRVGFTIPRKTYTLQRMIRTYKRSRPYILTSTARQ